MKTVPVNPTCDRPIRILVIAGFAESLLHFRGALLTAMQDRGIEIHVAAPNLSSSSAVGDQLRSRNMKTHDLPLERTGKNPLADLGAAWSLWRLMRRIRPDCVLSYTVKAVVYGSTAAWLAGVPRAYALITGAGYGLQASSGGHLRGLVKFLYRLGLRKVTTVIFQNRDDEALFRKLGLVARGTPSAVVNGSGVDLDHFSPVPLPEGRMRFLLIARLLGEKGIREYVKAAERVRLEHPDAEFALAGWIDSNPDSISQGELDRWIASGTIRFLGRLSDVRPAIAGCHVYVLPSYGEGTPRTVLEAMAMGRPIITTDVPGCRETVRPEENGLLVASQDEEALYRAMSSMIRNSPRLAAMAAQSRQIAETKYDVHQVNAEMLRIMRL